MFAVVRVRGSVKTRRVVNDTLAMLRLHRVNHAVLVPETPAFKGMLARAQSHITWGEVGEDTLARVLAKRLRLPARRRAGAADLKKAGFEDARALARALLEGKTTLGGAGFCPVLRLGPPRKGHGKAGIRKSFAEGGAAGYRGQAINALLEAMA